MVRNNRERPDLLIDVLRVLVLSLGIVNMICLLLNGHGGLFLMKPPL
jgi:hypothetical protein